MNKVILVTLLLSVLSTATVSSYATDKMAMPMPEKATAAHEAIKGQVIAISEDKTK